MTINSQTDPRAVLGNCNNCGHPCKHFTHDSMGQGCIDCPKCDLEQFDKGVNQMANRNDDLDIMDTLSGSQQEKDEEGLELEEERINNEAEQDENIPRTQEDFINSWRDLLKTTDAEEVNNLPEPLISLTRELSFINVDTSTRISGEVTIEYIPNLKYLKEFSLYNLAGALLNVAFTPVTFVKTVFICLYDVLRDFDNPDGPQDIKLNVTFSYQDTFGNFLDVRMSSGDLQKEE